MWRRPRWLVAHVVALVAVALFVNLGLWQLRRLDERRERNELIVGRADDPPVDVAELVTVGDKDPAVSVQDFEWRRARLFGTYVSAESVLLGPRTLDGRPGNHLLVPLHTSAGVVLVDRGWVPFEFESADIPTAAPPDGAVTVEGVLRATAPAANAVDRDGDGDLDVVSAVDVGRLANQLPGPLVTAVYLHRTTEQPPGAALPLTGALPTPDEGSHLSYAVQWFAFAGIVVVGYPFVLRRAASQTSDG